MKKTVFVLFFAALVAGCQQNPSSSAGNSAATVVANAAADDSPREIVAVVNGVEIPASLLLLYTQGQPIPDSEREVIVENAISSELASQAAVASGMAERPEVRDQIAFARQNILARAYIGDLLDNVDIDDARVAERFAELNEQGRTEYDAAHILVDTEEEALDLLAQIKADPSVFGKLAADFSKDPGSGANDGKLGWMSPQNLVPEFADALTQMQPGDLSQAPVQTQYGFHIIRVDDTREAEAPELTPQLRERIVQSERAKIITDHLADLREKATVELR